MSATYSRHHAFNTSTLAAIIGIASVLASTGCASRHAGHEVWTTKQQSMMGVKTDTPTLNAGELTTYDAQTSAAELRQPAIDILREAVESESPELRANAIEALHLAPEQIEAVVQKGLADENRAVRFVAAMTVGRLKLQSLTTLVEPLLHDESQSVKAAAIYALRRCGKVVDLNPLASMLLSEDPEVKGNAALVLGELGDPSAIPLLRHATGKGLTRVQRIRRRIVELQLAEAMVKLGATGEQDAIRAAIFSPMEEAELAALACQMAGQTRDHAALPDLTNLIHRTGKFQRPPEIRMAAALAVAQIDPRRSLVQVPAAYASDVRPELRAQAAHTMGFMSAGGPESQVAIAHLSRLLNDSNPLVQVAAAGAILRLQQAPAR